MERSVKLDAPQRVAMDPVETVSLVMVSAHAALASGFLLSRTVPRAPRATKDSTVPTVVDAAQHVDHMVCAIKDPLALVLVSAVDRTQERTAHSNATSPSTESYVETVRAAQEMFAFATRTSLLPSAWILRAPLA